MCVCMYIYMYIYVCIYVYSMYKSWWGVIESWLLRYD